MKKKNIYVKDNFKVEKRKSYIYDASLNKLSKKAGIEGYEELAILIKMILTASNKMELSYAINNLVNYYPKNEVDKDIKEKCVFCILLDSKKKFDLTAFLLTLEYKFDLNTSYYEFNDEIIFSDKIINIPYKSSFRLK